MWVTSPDKHGDKVFIDTNYIGGYTLSLKLLVVVAKEKCRKLGRNLLLLRKSILPGCEFQEHK